MSRRFGRNQRRALLDQLASVTATLGSTARQFKLAVTELGLKDEALRSAQKALFEALGGHYRMADGTEALTIPDDAVASFEETIERDAGREARKLRVVLGGYQARRSIDAKLSDLIHSGYLLQRLVAYRHCAWYVTSIEVDVDRFEGTTILRDRKIVLNLDAVTTRPREREFARRPTIGDLY